MSAPLNRQYNLRSCPTESSSEKSENRDFTPSNLDNSLGLSEASGTEYNSDCSQDSAEETSQLPANTIIEGDITVVEQEEDMSLHLSMPHFEGKPADDADEWLEMFENFCKINKLSEDRQQATFAMYLKDTAKTWYRHLPCEIKDNFARVIAAFRERFNGSDGLQPDMVILTLQQHANESVSEYISRVMNQTLRLGLSQSVVASLAVKGLRTELRNIVMPQQGLVTLEAVRRAATLAERTVNAQMTVQHKVVAAVESPNAIDVATLTNKVTEQVIAALSSKLNLNKNADQIWGYSQPHYNQLAQPSTQMLGRQQPYSQQFERVYQPAPASQHSQPSPTYGHEGLGQHQRHERRRNRKPCIRCGGRDCSSKTTCSAFGVVCNYCKGRNHFTETCLRKKNDDAGRVGK